MALAGMAQTNVGQSRKSGVFMSCLSSSENDSQVIDGQIGFGVELERAALDNPDLPLDFIHDILVSKSRGRAFAEPFIPE